MRKQILSTLKFLPKFQSFEFNNSFGNKYSNTNFIIYAEYPKEFNKTYRIKIAHTEKEIRMHYIGVFR